MLVGEACLEIPTVAAATMKVLLRWIGLADLVKLQARIWVVSVDLSLVVLWTHRCGGSGEMMFKQDGGGSSWATCSEDIGGYSLLLVLVRGRRGREGGSLSMVDFSPDQPSPNRSISDKTPASGILSDAARLIRMSFQSGVLSVLGIGPKQ